MLLLRKSRAHTSESHSSQLYAPYCELQLLFEEKLGGELLGVYEERGELPLPLLLRLSRRHA